MRLSSSERDIKPAGTWLRAIISALVVVLSALPWIPLSAAAFLIASGGHAHRAQGLAKRMRRHAQRPDFLERGRKFCFARDRSLHLVSSAERPVRLRKAFLPLSATCERRGAKLPALLLGRQDVACPWNSPPRFLAAASSPRMKQLRNFLADTIDLQADFLVERLARRCPRCSRPRPRSDAGRSRSNSTVWPAARRVATR